MCIVTDQKALQNAQQTPQDPYDFSDRYNTKLTPEEEAEFQKWERAKDVYDYDARGAWKAIREGKMSGPDEREHLGDKYKKPNHATFSTESVYHGKDGYEGGIWIKDQKGDYVAFRPGKTNMRSKEALRRYFAEAEPGIELQDMR